MRHTKGFALALGAILITMIVEVCSQPVVSTVPARGMMWTEDDQAKPVGFTGSCGFILATGQLTFTDYNIEQGYFEVSEFQGQMRPESPWLHRVRENRGKGVEILLRVREVPALDKLVR